MVLGWGLLQNDVETVCRLDKTYILDNVVMLEPQLVFPSPLQMPADGIPHM